MDRWIEDDKAMLMLVPFQYQPFFTVADGNTFQGVDFQIVRTLATVFNFR